MDGVSSTLARKNGPHHPIIKPYDQNRIDLKKRIQKNSFENVVDEDSMQSICY